MVDLIVDSSLGNVLAALVGAPIAPPPEPLLRAMSQATLAIFIGLVVWFAMGAGRLLVRWNHRLARALRRLQTSWKGSAAQRQHLLTRLGAVELVLQAVAPKRGDDVRQEDRVAFATYEGSLAELRVRLEHASPQGTLSGPHRKATSNATSERGASDGTADRSGAVVRGDPAP